VYAHIHAEQLFTSIQDLQRDMAGKDAERAPPPGYRRDQGARARRLGQPATGNQTAG
jgi:hypothetical protein